jgi:hypothetical protein
VIYSVWDHAVRAYRYYETPDRSAATSAPKPAHLRAAPLGLSPDEAAWPLPSNARPVGQGKYPRGLIASRGGSALGILPFDLTTPNLVIVGVVGYLLFKHFKKR